MVRHFRHKDVVRVFPWVKPATLLYWADRGLIKPDVAGADGRGSTRLYSYGNLVEIAVLSRLLGRGFSFRTIQGIVEHAAFREIVDGSLFDRVLWFRCTLSTADVPMDKAPSWIETAGSAPAVEFVEVGGSYLAGIRNESDISLVDMVSDAIVINFHGLSKFVDWRIGEAL